MLRTLFKAIAWAAAGCVLVVSAYVAYLWATYIDQTVTTGDGYGFSVGASKKDALLDVRALSEEYPELAVHVSYGPKAGDYYLWPVDTVELDNVWPHKTWHIQLDGKNEFHNIIRLHFENDSLREIYRHRKYFELP